MLKRAAAPNAAAAKLLVELNVLIILSLGCDLV
jgi:hypothetical protein